MEYYNEEPSQCTVLVVDDDPTTRLVLSRQLSGLDCNVMLAEDGYAALEIIAQALPDLILLDVMMPGIDGVEVVEHVREHYSTQFIPIILISVQIILHRRVGGPPTAAVMAHGIVGLIGFACACVVLHYTAVPFGAVIGLMLALATSVAWSLIVYTARRRGIAL